MDRVGDSWGGLLENPLELGSTLSSKMWLMRSVLPSSLSEVPPSLMDHINEFARGRHDEVHQQRLLVARTFMLSVLVINVFIMVFAMAWGVFVRSATPCCVFTISRPLN